MTSKPLFTVIMANHNNGRYIAEAIRSVLWQTYTNWELYIVDDGSTDNSMEVCTPFLSDTRIYLLSHQKNLGAGYAKWLGANESKGDIVSYLDSDDMLEPNALEEMVVAHLQHPEWVLIGSRYQELTGTDHLCQYGYPVGPQEGEPDDYLLSHPNRIVAFISFKRTAYNLTSGFDKKLSCTVDKDIFLKLEEVGGVACLGFIDKYLYRYRQDNSISVSLGSDAKLKYNQYNRAWVYLRAFERRYRSNSEHYQHYKLEYATKIYNELICVVRNRQHIIELRLLRYMWLYLEMNDFCKCSIRRCVKIILHLY